MAQPVGFFGLRLEPGKTHRMEVTRDFRVTQVAFADEAKDGAKALVKVTYTSFPDSYSDDEDDDDDEKSLPEPEEKTYTLCTLISGRTEQERVDVQFCEEELVGFSVTGDTAVDLIGNYVAPPDFYDQEPGSDDEYDSEDEDDFDMNEMDEMDEDGEDDEDEEDTEGRFEEIEESTPAKKEKKAIEAAAAASEASAKKRAASEIDSPASVLSKNQQKRLKKAEAASNSSTPTKKATESPAKKETKADNASPAKKDKAAEAAKAAKEAKEAKAKADAAAKKAAEKPAQKLSKTKLPSGLVIEEKKAGEGPQAKPGMKVGMRYVGKLENGKVFDQCVKGKPFSFKLGKGEVIKGWDEGVKGMRVGEERRLTCPPKLAYGNQKIPGIPPNSTLIFDVKLVEMK
ncbi:peptidylprolyl isomerase fpr3 [Thecaphora frezii]